MRVLGWFRMPSSPPSTWVGSSSGFVKPCQTEVMDKASVEVLRRREPCMLAENSKRGPEVLASVADAETLPDDRAPVAILVNRSEMPLICDSDGSMMCTSGSRHRGSRIPSTLAPGNTRTATF